MHSYCFTQIQRTRKVVMFKLLFWDAGEQCLNKFNHILPVSCKQFAKAQNICKKLMWLALTNLLEFGELAMEQLPLPPPPMKIH